MAQIIDLGKLRFHFAGEWSVSTTYEINDIVKYGGNVYVYTNIARTSGNLPTNPAYWALMVEGFKFREEWASATQYRVGDGVAHGGVVYIAVADSQGQTPPNATFWSQFADGIQWEGTYDPLTLYQANDVVKYGAQAYIARQDTTGNLPTNPAFWDTFVSGISAEGVYNAATTYVPGDLVAYGPHIYRCTAESVGNIPTNTNFFELFSTGNDFQGTWTSGGNYIIGQTVRYGGNLYIALRNNNAADPTTSPLDWELYQTGISVKGNWATATFYVVNDIVNHGGNTYQCLVTHTSSNFDNDLGAVIPKWQKFNSGVRYMGIWSTGTQYLKDDIVSESVSTYIATQDHVAGADFFIDNANGLWENFVVGASYVLPDTAGNNGKYLQTPDGINYSWQFAGANDRIYYVSEDSTSSADTPDHGQAIDYAFASLKYACDFINADLANRAPATIVVKDGTYREQLPIHIPPNVSIVGDGMRNCIIEPDTTNDNGFGVGISDDGVTPNNRSTMFFVNTGTLVTGLLLRGMTGYVPNGSDPTDPTGATIGGVYFRLEPGATIVKSPYIKDCSSFSTGGIGAIVDGSVVASGTAGSMVFHAYTNIHDGGIAFWIKDNGLSEIVSCFTYYCDIGYIATGGGKIRSLNGNNSYGTYGSVSNGFDTTEIPLNGYMYGDTITYDPSTLATSEGFTVGDTITGVAKTGNRVVNSLSIASQATVTTAEAHGLSDGDMISFTNVNEAAWQSLLGDISQNDRRTWYADVLTPTTFRLCTNFDLTNYFDTRALAGWGFVLVNFADATRSNPVRVTTTAPHNFSNGEAITEITGVVGMTQLNGNDYFVSVVDATTIDLYTDAGLTTPLNGVGFGAYVSGGTGTRTLTGTTLTPCDIIVADQPEAEIANIQTNLVVNHRLVINNNRMGVAGQTIKVHVGPAEYLQPGNRYYFNNWIDLAFNGYEQRQYIFEQNDVSNVGHPMYLSTTQGDINGANAYTTGVEYYLDGVLQASLSDYVTNFAAATAREVRLRIALGASSSTPRLYMCCYVHANMGNGSIFVNAPSATAKERYIGNTFYPFASGSTITAGDGQSATVAGDANSGQFGFSLVLGGLDEEPREGGSIQFTTGLTFNPVDNAGITQEPNYGQEDRSFIITTVSGWTPSTDPRIGGVATVTLSQEKQNTSPTFYGQHFNIRYNYSQVRLTGHDFLSIGTGGKLTTNYPGTPTQAASQGNEVTENLPGRVYYVSTDQDGNFRVGNFFRIDQATGRATLDASAFDLSGLTSLRLGSIGAQLGESINEFSADGLLSGNSNVAVPTEQAVKTYVDTTRQSLVDNEIAAIGTQVTGLASQISNISLSDVFLSQTYNDANTVFDVDGYITSATVGTIEYSNVVYETIGPSDQGGFEFSRYKRIVSYTETNTETSTTNNVVIAYNENGSVDTITVTEV